MSTLPYTGPTPVPAPDLAGLMAYFVQALDALEQPPTKQILQPGLQVSWDSCKAPNCGMGWVRLVRIAPVTTPPSRVLANGRTACGVTGWLITLGVGVLRCVSTIDSSGRMPSASAITKDGYVFTQDAAVLTQLLSCDDNVAAFLETTPLGPDGGCAGVEVTFQVRINCISCFEGEP